MNATFSGVMVVLGMNARGKAKSLVAESSVKTTLVNGKREKFRRMW